MAASGIFASKLLLHGLGDGAAREDQVYSCLGQEPSSDLRLVVRTAKGVEAVQNERQ